MFSLLLVTALCLYVFAIILQYQSVFDIRPIRFDIYHCKHVQIGYKTLLASLKYAPRISEYPYAGNGEGTLSA